MKRNLADWARDTFRSRSPEDEARKSAKDYFDAADARAREGEYIVAISQFRTGMRKTKPEDGIDSFKRFQVLSNEIQKHAVQNMGASAHSSLEFTEELVATAPSIKQMRNAVNEGKGDYLASTAEAMSNLSRVKDCFTLLSQMETSPEALTDANLDALLLKLQGK